MPKKVLVLCTGNSCRSQMAEGYLKKYNPSALVRSAGVATHGLNPLAVKVMSEDGVDISNHTSNLVDEYMDIPFDFVITVCDHASEVCPVFPGVKRQIHQNFDDPSKLPGTEEEVLPAYRVTRDAIKQFIEQLSTTEFIS